MYFFIIFNFYKFLICNKLKDSETYLSVNIQEIRFVPKSFKYLILHYIYYNLNVFLVNTIITKQ